MTATALNALGITKARAAEVAKAFGSSSCRCQQRQEWMNEAGRQWLGIGNPPPAGDATGPVP